jgi:hypothetical protein
MNDVTEFDLQGGWKERQKYEKEENPSGHYEVKTGLYILRIEVNILICI